MDTAMWKRRAYCFKRSTVGSGEGRWRSTPQEQLAGGLSYYIKDYDTVPRLESGLADYFELYNRERPHQSLNYRTPAELYFS